MVTSIRVRSVLSAVLLLIAATPALAQPIGAFRWQQQPYCNVITVAVEQEGGVYRLTGSDDQCGAGTVAAVTGLALPNPNGTIGFGLTIVTSPSGTPLHLDASIAFPALSGTWRDSAGATGAWTFTPGASAGGTVRPVPRLSFPGGISAAGSTVTNVGTPVSSTDAATKGYVDTAARALQSVPEFRHAWEGLTSGSVTSAPFGCMTFGTASPSSLRLDLPMPEGAVLSAVRVRYRHIPGASASMTFDVRAVTFSNAGAVDGPWGASASSIDSGFSTTVITMPVPAGLVRPDREFYIDASSPAHTGFLAFCGAAPIYTIP
jgi:hypothetical protein